MKNLLHRLKESVIHLQALDEVLLKHSHDFKLIEGYYKSKEFKTAFNEITQQIYSGGKSANFSRQMILGDLIIYIMSGRAYYYASKDKSNLKNFLKLTLYVVNQMLLYDLITTNPKIRLAFIKLLEKKISQKHLYEKEGDKQLVDELKKKFRNVKLWDNNYARYDDLMDSLIPKTLGAPKELIVYAELLRLKKGYVIPLLLIQRILGQEDSIAPPDFLLLRKNKDIYGIELGYEKELQSREFVLKTSIPTFAVDLIDNQFNRCPICGENILYCEKVIELYSSNELDSKIKQQNEIVGRGRKRINKYICIKCDKFNNGKCRFSNYFDIIKGKDFIGRKLSKQKRHYHTKCVVSRIKSYTKKKNFIEKNLKNFFAQIPKISGIDNF